VGNEHLELDVHNCQKWCGRQKGASSVRNQTTEMVGPPSRGVWSQFSRSSWGRVRRPLSRPPQPTPEVLQGPLVASKAANWGAAWGTMSLNLAGFPGRQAPTS
jgi:hypothetical protein